MDAEVAVLGAGYVGVTTAAVLAERGSRVTLIDPIEDKVDRLQAGEIPFHEPGLGDLVAELVDAERLAATTDVADAGGVDYVFVCVGTPSADDGTVDLAQIRSAADDAAELADGSTTVVVKSTVPPGTTRSEVASRLPDGSGVAANPEFLSEGSALEDARNPDRIVVGVDGDHARKAMESLYTDVDAPTYWFDLEGAEAVKYFANAFLALKISFANEAANLCEDLGVDWLDVVDAVGADDRIDPAFFVPGAGFGGSCFPKDVRALRAVARDRDIPTRLLDALLEVNQAQPIHVVDRLEAAIDGLDGRRVAVLGLAFKPGTDDVRNTRALPIVEELADRGADVIGHDPEATGTFAELAPEVETTTDVDAALADADAAIVQAAWPAYADVSASAWPPFVVDACRAFDAEQIVAFEETGKRVLVAGRGERP